MNTYARKYLEAKAAYEATIEMMNEFEENFLAERGYAVKRAFTIENEEEFDRVSLELGNLFESNGMSAMRYEASENKVAAEEELIKFALSIVPDKEKAILHKAAKTNWKTRQQIIALALKYEPSKGDLQ